jgi:hypothetical protein
MQLLCTRREPDNDMKVFGEQGFREVVFQHKSSNHEFGNNREFIVEFEYKSVKVL